ncbi:Heme A synthase [Sphingomonas antarctica]|uniref:COX15/CtaA family protein n=1 Tax=Sphingomonas antarctica TaxID=2040274 RepID=UPI0039E9B9FA
MPQPLKLARWLFIVAAMVFAIVVIGGLTRLTESGLSITEWKPVSGTLPPLNGAAWAQAYAEYLRIPQAKTVHAGITLGQFKFIFFWEWVHRLLARVIGLALLLPLIWYWVRGAVPAGYKPRLIALVALVGFQGAIGWWMVTSGLLAGEHVSHIRLSIHLLTALFLMAGLIWTALDLRSGDKAHLTPVAIVAALVLAIQLTLGAWVAGMRAGYVASDWPLMQGRMVPDGIDWTRGIAAFATDPYLVHFLHRWWAWVAVAALVALARQVKRAGDRRASTALYAAFGTQILLGIATVMTGISLPLAILHQANGALLVAATAWAAHAVGTRRV